MPLDGRPVTSAKAQAEQDKRIRDLNYLEPFFPYGGMPFPIGQYGLLSIDYDALSGAATFDPLTWNIQ